MENFDVAILNQIEELPQRDQIIQHDNLFLFLTDLWFWSDGWIKSENILDELIT